MVGIRGLVIAACALCALAPSASASIPAPPSKWYALPGLNAASGAQWVRALAYGTPPNIVYAGLEGGGVFKSETGGATWSAFNSGFPNPLITNVRALLTSSTGTTVWAGTDDGLWKSDGGAWQRHAQGPEPDPANPTKLNQSVQSLIGLTGGSTMLAGVFSGGVYKSSDGGDTWKPPPANNGMSSYETIYSITETVPGLVYATGHSGVYLSTNQGSTWTRMSDGIGPGASPIATWMYPQRPQLLFTSTGSDGIYRSINGGITWSAINDGLGAVRARGFVMFPGPTNQQDVGAMLYAATENALWATHNKGTIDPPPPRWRQVTKEGLATSAATNEIMWALTPPVIPGAGALGLIAGTQSDGGFFLSFEAVDSPCPESHTTNTTTDCPRLSDTSPQVGNTVSVANGEWTGTPLISYEYQWQRCTTVNSGCADIADAQETTYVVDGPDQGKYLRVKVTATNPAPSFGGVVRYSAISAQVAAPSSAMPGYNQVCAPPIVNQTGETTSPVVGDTLYADKGSCTAADPTYGWFNPKSDSVPSYRWLRCEDGASDCNEISGATQRSYVLQRADGSRTVKVRVRGTASGYSNEITSGASYYVISLPAEVDDPFTDPDTGQQVSNEPKIVGDPYVGETLAGNVGAWKDPTTTFLKRWMRCDADGTGCTYIQKEASTDPEDGSTYLVRPGDLGYRIKLELQADVNNDLADDGLDNHLPHSVYKEPISEVVTYRPVPVTTPPPPPPGGGTTTPPPDKLAPVITSLSLTKTKFVAGKGTTFVLKLSERSTLRIVITKATKGRKVGKRCVKQTRKNRKRKRCTYQKKITTITRRNQAPGIVRIPFSGKVGKRKLKPGTYRATVTSTDAAGNVSKAVTILFRIVRR